MLLNARIAIPKYEVASAAEIARPPAAGRYMQTAAIANPIAKLMKKRRYGEIGRIAESVKRLAKAVAMSSTPLVSIPLWLENGVVQCSDLSG